MKVGVADHVRSMEETVALLAYPRSQGENSMSPRTVAAILIVAGSGLIVFGLTSYTGAYTAVFTDNLVAGQFPKEGRYQLTAGTVLLVAGLLLRRK